VVVEGCSVLLVDTPEAKTPERGNEEALRKAEHVADEEIVRQYG